MFLSFFMLFSSFAFVYSAAEPLSQDENMGSREVSFDLKVLPGRSSGNSSVMRVLKNSPGTVGEKREALKSKEINQAAPKPLDFGDECCQMFNGGPTMPLASSKAKQYLVYVSLMDSETGLHMTIRKTVVDQSTCENLHTKLKGVKQQEGKWTLPCQIPVKLYRDAETGLVSPTRKSIARAFDNTPASIRYWLEAPAMLNDSERISEILACIPDDNPEFGHYPLGHTEQKACRRGEAIVPIYTSCEVEISEVPSARVKKMKEERFEKIAKLEELIKKMDAYFQSDIGLVSGCPSIKNVQTIADGLKEEKEVFTTAARLRSERFKFNKNFSRRYTNATTMYQAIVAHFSSTLYKEFLTEPLLAGALTSSTPLETCMIVPELLLNALKKQTHNPGYFK